MCHLELSQRIIEHYQLRGIQCFIENLLPGLLSKVTVYRDRGGGLFGRYCSMVFLRSSEMPQENLEIHREYLEILRDWKAKKKARMLRGYSELNNQKIRQKKRLPEIICPSACG